GGFILISFSSIHTMRDRESFVAAHLSFSSSPKSLQSAESPHTCAYILVSRVLILSSVYAVIRAPACSRMIAASPSVVPTGPQKLALRPRILVLMRRTLG